MRKQQTAISYQRTNPPTSPFVKGGQEGDLLNEGIRRDRENVIHSVFRSQQSALRNEKGIALVMVLILSVISLAIMAGLIYMLTSRTQISGMQKRYKTALEATKGGNDVAHQIINLKASETEISNLITSLSGAITTSAACVVAATADPLPDGKTTCNDHIADCAGWVDANRRGLCVKLSLPTYCWSGCDSSLTINPPPSGDNTTYDMRFNLGNYRAHAKIVDTVWGNSSPSTEDLGGGKGVVDSGTEISTVHIPFLYTIEVNAQNQTNPAERAKLSVMYQF